MYHRRSVVCHENETEQKSINNYRWQIKCPFAWPSRGRAEGHFYRERNLEKWVVSAKKADFKEIGKKFGIDQVTARLIRNRDVVGDEAIEEYLNGSLLNLHSPHLLKDCDKAVFILTEKIREQKKIRIMGDYDIDGVCATYILYRGLMRCGANADAEIPDRIKDGYGLNDQLITLAEEDGVDTILTCDNGISAVDQVEHARKKGMTVIITDHHELSQELPGAHAIVNPKQEDCSYPFKGLCGAAVALKVISSLYESMGISDSEWEELITFAAIATVGDVMDLRGENRILVREGLLRIPESDNYGLKALIQVNNLDPEKISSYHIGFVLGPCINASGRLDTAKKALKLFLSRSEQEAMELASELKGLNDERKEMTLKGVARAVEKIECSSLKEDKVLVVYLPECHESLAGIIAGRLRERYYKPVFVLTRGEEGVKGSGRSIEAYHMFQEMEKCRELFVKFGGHPMAAGLSIREEMVEKLRNRLNRQTTLTEEDLTPKITIDIAMPIDYISEHLIEELEYLEPFGKGNQKPVFAEKGLEVLSGRILGKNKNVLKFQVKNRAGAVLDAMYFGDTQQFLEDIRKKFGPSEVEKMFQGRKNKVSLTVTYYPSVNVFRDARTLQIVIQNYQ